MNVFVCRRCVAESFWEPQAWSANLMVLILKQHAVSYGDAHPSYTTSSSVGSHT